MNSSEMINDIMTALAKAQGEFGKVTKGKEAKITASNSYSYADLATVCDAIVPVLSKNGIAIVQGSPMDNPAIMETLLAHSSGQWIATYVPIYEGRNGGAQGYGSGMTYARRYGLLAAVGVAPEDDDDGAKASGANTKPRNVATAANDGMEDAWRDAIEDSLPENATGRQRAEAYANAIIADMERMKSARGVNGVWNKRGSVIDQIANKHHDLHMEILDRFNACLGAFNEEPEAA